MTVAQKYSTALYLYKAYRNWLLATPDKQIDMILWLLGRVLFYCHEMRQIETTIENLISDAGENKD